MIELILVFLGLCLVFKFFELFVLRKRVDSYAKEQEKNSENNTNSNPDYSYTFLLSCINSSIKIDELKFYLDNGADINFQDENGSTALMLASRRGLNKIVFFLLDNNADVDMKDNSGLTAITYAIMGKEVKIVETLLAYNANINSKTNDGFTPILYALTDSNVNIKSIQLIKLLLQHHPDTDDNILEMTDNPQIKELLRSYIS